jgi:hypothetical protein
VELRLPARYEGGDLSKDVGIIVEKLRSFGADFEPFAQVIEQNPSVYVIWAFDPRVGDTGFLTNVNVTEQQTLSSVPVETLMEAAIQQLPSGFDVVERGTVALDSYQAQRFVIEFTVSGVMGKEVLYAVKEGDTLWTITYATGFREFVQRRAEFELRAQTFAAQP